MFLNAKIAAMLLSAISGLALAKPLAFSTSQPGTTASPRPSSGVHAHSEVTFRKWYEDINSNLAKHAKDLGLDTETVHHSIAGISQKVHITNSTGFGNITVQALTSDNTTVLVLQGSGFDKKSKWGAEKFTNVRDLNSTFEDSFNLTDLRNPKYDLLNATTQAKRFADDHHLKSDWVVKIAKYKSAPANLPKSQVTFEFALYNASAGGDDNASNHTGGVYAAVFVGVDDGLYATDITYVDRGNGTAVPPSGSYDD